MKWIYSWYLKKGKNLSQNEREQLETQMSALDQALLSKNKKEASDFAHNIEAFGSTHCKKTIFEYAWELILALIFALIIATIVRQTWFELYEIPTGSMRPNFREKDHLTVTKTTFGINWPLETDHLYFDPELIQRTGVLIFSGDGLPLDDVDTTYFGLFPYKKRYIKRLIGKPGDTLYFYGGQIYGVDKDGNDLKELREAPWIQDLEYIPFLSFSGEVSATSNSILFKQMHRLAGRLTFNILGNSTGEVYTGKEWVHDDPTAQITPHTTIKTYSDILGIRNYAEARLLTKKELSYFADPAEKIEEGVLYLHLRHTPSLTYPKPLVNAGSMGGVSIPAYSTFLPLQQQHLDRIMENLYTSRFIIREGKGTSYRSGQEKFRPDSPSFQGIENGAYEFYHGKATKILWGGIESEVPSTNPLYSHSPENVQKLFNLGIHMSQIHVPRQGNLTYFPHRYAYFRDGDLYLMGALIMKKEDPALTNFLKREEARQARGTQFQPYVAFHDYGPPITDKGHIDQQFIKTFGVTVPDKQYLVLGDNHAISADSRVFGFVPEKNIQGSPYWIIWPPGERLGAPPQTPYPFMNVPRAIIWSIAGVVFICWFIWHRRSLSKPIFVKKLDKGS